jgi:4,5-dihydroxyphthalate decarboxylase
VDARNKRGHDEFTVWAAAGEEQEEVLGPDPWAYDLGPPNRRNLGAIPRYTRQQGLISRAMSLDDLFIDFDLGDAG